MAIVVDSTVGDRRILNRRAQDRTSRRTPLLRDGEGMRIAWGGVWAGLFVVLAILVLLSSLGLAVGVSAVDPSQPDAQTLSTGAAIWAGVSLLIALFFGGLVSTRSGLVYDRATGAYEGALVWILSILVVLLMAGGGVGLVAGGAFKLQNAAEQVRATASTTAWITFGALVFSLIAAVLGAMAGRRRAAVVTGHEAA